MQYLFMHLVVINDRLREQTKGKEHECVQICNSTGISSASHGSQLADFGVYAVNWINDAWKKEKLIFQMMNI